MRIISSILSFFYIARIFLFADSPVVSKLSPYNLYSILRIPLYGILTILLIFSILPFKIKLNNPINQMNQKDQIDQIVKFQDLTSCFYKRN